MCTNTYEIFWEGIALLEGIWDGYFNALMSPAGKHLTRGTLNTGRLLLKYVERLP